MKKYSFLILQIITFFSFQTLMAEPAYTDETRVKDLPIEAVILKGGFKVGLKERIAYFKDGNPVSAADANSSYCFIAMKNSQERGALVNSKNATVAFGFDGFEGDYSPLVNIKVKDTKNIEYFSCRSVGAPTLKDFKTHFGALVDLTISEMDIIDPPSAE